VSCDGHCLVSCCPRKRHRGRGPAPRQLLQGFVLTAILARLARMVNRQHVWLLDQTDWGPAVETEILPPPDPLVEVDAGAF